MQWVLSSQVCYVSVLSGLPLFNSSFFFKFPILVSFLNLHSWDCKIVICVHWWLAVSTIQHPNNVIFLWNRLIGWQRDLNKLKCGDYLCIAKLLQIISHYLYTKPRLITFPFPSRLFPPSPSPSLVLLWCLSVTATFPLPWLVFLACLRFLVFTPKCQWRHSQTALYLLLCILHHHHAFAFSELEFYATTAITWLHDHNNSSR